MLVVWAEGRLHFRYVIEEETAEFGHFWKCEGKGEREVKDDFHIIGRSTDRMMG